MPARATMPMECSLFCTFTRCLGGTDLNSRNYSSNQDSPYPLENDRSRNPDLDLERLAPKPTDIFSRICRPRYLSLHAFKSKFSSGAKKGLSGYRNSDMGGDAVISANSCHRGFAFLKSWRSVWARLKRSGVTRYAIS